MNIFNRSILAYRVFRSYLSRIRSLLLYYTVESYIIKKQQALNRQLEKKIQGKKLVNVCFFVLDSSIWKYDSLYFLMEKSTQFNPVLLITPYMTFSESERMEKMNATYNYFKNKGYRVIHSYNNKKEQWLDVMSEISPDIIFYTNPYHAINKKEYYIRHLSRILSCYISYGYMMETYRWEYDLLFHNLLWLQFSESEVNHNISKCLMRIGGRNNIVTGYPFYDLFCGRTNYNNVWKNLKNGHKKIIWAPHHSIEYNGISTFFLYADVMLELAEKYKDKLQIAFKPHPLLLQKLYNWPEWGKERADSYYNKWMSLANCQYESGDYVDLFLGSDAMIHDSMSFTVEYIYTLKPVLYLDRKNSVDQRGLLDYNQVGVEAYRSHYDAYDLGGIYDFLNDVVLKGNDPLYMKRNDFFTKHLRPLNGCSVAENIMSILCSYL